jgi:hypothetical protein
VRTLVALRGGRIVSAPISFKEFADLVNLIKREHSPHTFQLPVNGVWPKNRRVKYIDPHFDMRTNDVFGIKIRLMGGGEQYFHIMNECRDLEESLYERVVKWLKGE